MKKSRECESEIKLSRPTRVTLVTLLTSTASCKPDAIVASLPLLHSRSTWCTAKWGSELWPGQSRNCLKVFQATSSHSGCPAWWHSRCCGRSRIANANFCRWNHFWMKRLVQSFSFTSNFSHFFKYVDKLVVVELEMK